MRELFNSIIWQSHIPGLIRFFSTLVLLVLAVTYNLQVRNEFDNSTSNYTIQSSVSGGAQDSQQMLNGNIAEYLALRERGYIGEPRRLQWIESFRALADTWQLPSLKFTLGEEHLLSPGEAYYSETVAMRVTPMRIDMELAHEGDFYRLLEGLRESALGVFSIENCKLDWQPNESGELSLTRLRGACELNWYNLVDITETWDLGEG